MDWDMGRRRELENLFRLCVEASSLNHGSNVAERIILCEKLANELITSDLSDGRPSFHQFLVGLVRCDLQRPL